MIHRDSVTLGTKADNAAVLLSLRHDFRNGCIDKTQFLLAAAEMYLNNQLLLRAMALMHLVEKETLLPDQSFQFYQLQQKITTFPPLPYKRCTLNMIVKDEEKAIVDALDSADLIMDEIVLCDTGSTDTTVYLAEQYGVTVVYDLWQHDFSRARNTAITASTCDWIFWMDADDRLEKASLEPLQKLWRSASPQGAAFCIVNDRDYAAPVEFIQVRLFPRDEDIRFEQRVHEQVMFSIARKKIPFSRHPEIRIRHTGYKSSEIHLRKAKRNKPLLLAEIEKNPDDPTLQLSLADCLLILGETDTAQDYYYRIIRNEGAWLINSDVYVQAHINLAKIYTREGDASNAKRYFLRSLYLDKTRIEAWYALGRMFLDEGDEQKAARYLINSARITPPPSSIPRWEGYSCCSTI
jgi:glycosyltransferase involved in cell wall biosynthesis